MKVRVGTNTLPPEMAALLLRGELVLEWTAAAPASIMAFWVSVRRR